ncbi:hypothetical protein [Streptomyces sp. S.PB5]|uniref:hypothetical protein n=1 Tax=Streptomyces sp. S.PB5 TaxID=3020844 RepID=UPI0025B077DE|nr:hypothetical protein [Streptomyces sp. S.PB5]MDN3029733.1 hypothetical protein [Streptomyces sp. S.PB5]
MADLWAEYPGTPNEELIGYVRGLRGSCRLGILSNSFVGARERETSLADTRSAPRDAAKPKSQVPMWREGLAWSVLSVDYQRILQTLADRLRLHQGPLTCQEMAAAFGMDVVPTRVEALRSKAKRLVARGWLAEPTPGRFTLAQSLSGPGGGS